MIQAAIYARVSTQQQKEEETINSQRVTLLKFAKENNYHVPDTWIFEDNGISGSTLVRPALERLRDLASEGIIETVIISSPDRLARKYTYQALLIEEFEKNGVNIQFLHSQNDGSNESKLLRQMQGAFAEYERAQITERCRRGKRYKAQKGSVSVLSNAPYGYRYVRANLVQEASFEVVDNEVSVIKLIFDLFVKKRFSVLKIARELSERGIFTPSGKNKWNASTVHNILTNSSYTGVAYYGVAKKCDPNPDRLKSRRLRSRDEHISRYSRCKRDESDWIAIPVPKIIDDDLYESVQEILKRNKVLSMRNTKKGSLLQGLIACQECGYAFSSSQSGASKANRYYRCSGKQKCGNKGIRQEQLDEEIWSSVTSLLENPDLIREEVQRRLLEASKEPNRQKKIQIEKDISHHEEEMERLMDGYQAGCLPLESFQERMKGVRGKINDAKRAIEKLGKVVNKRQLLELDEAIKSFSDKLQSAKKELSFEEKRKILRMLIRTIVIGKDGITVNHIISPCTYNLSENAQLNPRRVDTPNYSLSL